MTPHVCERTPADFSFRHADKNLGLQVFVSFSLVSSKKISVSLVFFFSVVNFISVFVDSKRSGYFH